VKCWVAVPEWLVAVEGERSPVGVSSRIRGGRRLARRRSCGHRHRHRRGQGPRRPGPRSPPAPDRASACAVTPGQSGWRVPVSGECRAELLGVLGRRRPPCPRCRRRWSATRGWPGSPAPEHGGQHVRTRAIRAGASIWIRAAPRPSLSAGVRCPAWRGARQFRRGSGLWLAAGLV
jgi:hypothetical protein